MSPHRNTRLRHLLAAWVAALATSTAAAQVKLEFAWPDGLQATVTQSKSRTRTGPAAPPPRGQAVIYAMKVSAQQGGLRVELGDMRLDPAALPPAMDPAERRQAELLAKVALPSYVVKPGGEFDRIDNPAQLKASLLGWLEQMAADGKGIEPRMRQMLDQVTAPEVLHATAAADWNQLVGYWLGASLDMGETYEDDSQVALPLLPGTLVKLNSRFLVVRELPCTRDGQARRCVEIEVASSPDKAEVAAAVEALLRKLAPEAAAREEVVDSIDLQQTLVLVTEPQGLIPHEMRTRKLITLTTRKGDQRATVTELQQSQTTYRYPEAGR